LKKKPLVSVLLNCYNAERHIKFAIKSVLDQNFKDFELIIWDDASTDNTDKVIKRFKSNKIKYFKNNKHLGLGKSRIAASKKIKGKFVCIIDADDVFYKKKLLEQVKFIDIKSNISFVTSWCKIIDDNGKTIFNDSDNYNMENFKKYLCYKNIFRNSSIMYKKKIAQELNWYSNSLEYAQDFDLIINFLKNYKFIHIKKYLCKIRFSKYSMSFDKKFELLRIKEKIYLLNKARLVLNLKKIDFIKNFFFRIYLHLKYKYLKFKFI